MREHAIDAVGFLAGVLEEEDGSAKIGRRTAWRCRRRRQVMLPPSQTGLSREPGTRVFTRAPCWSLREKSMTAFTFRRANARPPKSSGYVCTLLMFAVGRRRLRRSSRGR